MLAYVEMRNGKRGVILSALSFAMWGGFPIYWKLLGGTPPLEILAHRVVWAFVFCIVLLTLLKKWAWVGTLRANPRLLWVMLGSTITVSINWFVYIAAVNSGHVVEASLGYFINPFVSIAAGVLFFREHLRKAQWLAIAIAAIGVVYLAVVSQAFPWIGLVLAFSFGVYGVLRKIAPLGSLEGLTFETALIFPFALGWLIWCAWNGSGSFITDGAWTTFFLIMAGAVTAIPLLLYAAGARAITLTQLGILQYIAPTLQFLLGVLLYHEPFDGTRLIGYALVWLALAIYAIEGALHGRNGPRQNALNAA